MERTIDKEKGNTIFISDSIIMCIKWPSLSWPYGSLMYNYLCNQCLSPLKLWVRTPFIGRCTQYNIMRSSLSVTCDRSVVFSGFSGYFHQ